jgi:thymidylate synthase ThyX
MDAELALYAPDFPVENWTEEDRFFLEPFFTNIDGHVTLVKNLPPELVGALCSKASRSPAYLLRVFLEEYVYPILRGDDRMLAEELREAVQFFRKHSGGSLLNNERARQFYRKWLAEYGDDSIAELTGAHVVCWGLSQVALKFVEDQRIGLEPIEKSTRYVNFGKKINGRYLYYIPRPDLERLDLLKDYLRVMDGLFDDYNALVRRFIDWLRQNYPNERPLVLEKKAFDTLRGLLPMATLGQVSFRGNAQAWEYLINRTAEHNLGELRWLAAALLKELNKEMPSLFIRVQEDKAREYQSYLARRRARVQKWVDERAFDQPEFGGGPKVCLVEYDPKMEDKIVAALLFPHMSCSWNTVMDIVAGLSFEEKLAILMEHFEGRTERWQKVGRAFENSYLRFEILMDIGAYRDLHRHRMLTQDRQNFTVRHGFNIPRELVEGGFDEEYRRALESVVPLFNKLEEGSGPEIAQYVVPLAYQVRFYQWENLRELFWEVELRTTPQGHPSYRQIEQEKYRLLEEKLPLISRFIKADLNDYVFARRGIEAKIQSKEERLRGKS